MNAEIFARGALVNLRAHCITCAREQTLTHITEYNGQRSHDDEISRPDRCATCPTSTPKRRLPAAPNDVMSTQRKHPISGRPTRSLLLCHRRVRVLPLLACGAPLDPREAAVEAVGESHVGARLGRTKGWRVERKRRWATIRLTTQRPRLPPAGAGSRSASELGRISRISRMTCSLRPLHWTLHRLLH